MVIDLFFDVTHARFCSSSSATALTTTRVTLAKVIASLPATTRDGNWENRQDTDATDKHVASFGTKQAASASVNDRRTRYLPARLPACPPACLPASLCSTLPARVANCHRPRPFISAALRQTHMHPFSWRESSPHTPPPHHFSHTLS